MKTFQEFRESIEAHDEAAAFYHGSESHKKGVPRHKVPAEYSHPTLKRNWHAGWMDSHDEEERQDSERTAKNSRRHSSSHY